MTTLQPDEPTRADVDRFARALGKGRANARTAKALRVVGDDRTLRNLAQYAPTYGHLILSGNEGYWLAENMDEVSECCGRLESQSYKMLDRAKRLREMCARSMAQESLF